MTAVSEDRLGFLRRLRAVKEFSDEPVDQSTIEQILEVGRWSASAGNRQPVELIVIRDADVRRQLGEWGAEPAATAAVVLLLVVPKDGSVFDQGRAAERLCLAAAACGLGATVATLKGEGPERARPLLGIPTEYQTRTLVAIGHPDVEARRARPKNPQARKPMQQYAHWDRF
jgi:nitroreductase